MKKKIYKSKTENLITATTENVYYLQTYYLKKYYIYQNMEALSQPEE